MHFLDLLSMPMIRRYEVLEQLIWKIRFISDHKKIVHPSWIDELKKYSSRYELICKSYIDLADILGRDTKAIDFGFPYHRPEGWNLRESLMNRKIDGDLILIESFPEDFESLILEKDLS